MPQDPFMGEPARSTFVGPMRGNEPQRPRQTGNSDIDALFEYLFQRELRRYLASNGISAPLAQQKADFAQPILRNAEDMARDYYERPGIGAIDSKILNSWER